MFFDGVFSIVSLIKWMGNERNEEGGRGRVKESIWKSMDKSLEVVRLGEFLYFLI